MMNTSSPLAPNNVGRDMTGTNIYWDDATWIMTSSFIIFTMQSGFGLLESGYVNKKNEVNIMVKNAVDVIFGGLGYWMFGYAFSFGTAPGTNFFIGIGNFFVDAQEQNMGVVFSTYIFQLSFATTATTIVSGAMAERTNFLAYCLFSFCNTFIFSLPAGWVWKNGGFLKSMNVVDIAGCSVVHLVGGTSALVAAILLKPRLGRYDNGNRSMTSLGSPTNALVGMFMLWWGWLGFNCGSTFGVSGHKWKYAARSAIVTINSSVGGGIAALIFSYLMHHKKFMVTDLINGILASLVAITGGCALYHPWEALVVGIVGSILANCTMPLLDKLHIDDPVGAISVHGAGSIWGMLAVGLFVEKDNLLKLSGDQIGLFRGGGWRLLGLQLMAIIIISTWSMVTTFILLYIINKFVPIRMTPEEEKAGADLVEHNIRYDYDTSVNRFPKLDLATINSIKRCMETSNSQIRTNVQGSRRIDNDKPPQPEKHHSSTQTENSSPVKIQKEPPDDARLEVSKMEDSREIILGGKEREVLGAWLSDDEKKMISYRVCT